MLQRENDGRLIIKTTVVRALSNDFFHLRVNVNDRYLRRRHYRASSVINVKNLVSPCRLKVTMLFSLSLSLSLSFLYIAARCRGKAGSTEKSRQFAVIAGSQRCNVVGADNSIAESAKIGAGKDRVVRETR